MADSLYATGPMEDIPEDAPTFPSSGKKAKASSSGFQGLSHREKPQVALLGRSHVVQDKRKFRYDVLRGKRELLAFSVSRDDRMTAEEAGDALHRLHVMLGVSGANEDVLYSLDQALFVCHTLNGASTLLPGRSKFGVPSRTESFEYSVVRESLGVDFRRFFRALADDITDANRRVLESYDPYDPEKVELHGQLMQVATERGLHRYPWLAHDSADACVKLSLAERRALTESKQLVVSSTSNSVDRYKPVRAGDGSDH